MFETGDLVPDLKKIELIAKAFGCTPEWLAWGKAPGPNQVDVLFEIGADADTGLQNVVGEFWLDAEFRRGVLQRYRPSNLACVRGAAGSQGFSEGEVAIVAPSEKLSDERAPYAYFIDGVAHISILSGTEAPPSRHVHLEDASVEAFDNATHLLGRVVSILKTS